MKILQLIHKPQNRGAETFACQLSNHLKVIGHDVKILSIYEGEGKLPFQGEIETLGASVSPGFFNFKTWKNLAVIINEYNPDIVQANAGDTLKFAALSKTLFHWTNPIIFRNASEVGKYLRSPLHRYFNSFFFSKVDHVISVSKASRKDLLFHFPFLKGQINVIPIGLEHIPTIKEIQLEPKEAQHIVHVGGFSFEKNHRGLLRIFQLVLKENSNIHLHLIGDGPLKKQVEELVQGMDLKDKVSFYGFVQEPLPFIRAADVLVLPSLIEGLPGVLLESMYCKTPVIAYDVGGISEIIDQTSGTLISKNEEKSFVEKILLILESKNHEQIETAYKMVKKFYMNRQVALNFVKTYNKVATRHL